MKVHITLSLDVENWSRFCALCDRAGWTNRSAVIDSCITQLINTDIEKSQTPLHPTEEHGPFKSLDEALEYKKRQEGKMIE